MNVMRNIKIGLDKTKNCTRTRTLGIGILYAVVVFVGALFWIYLASLGATFFTEVCDTHYYNIYKKDNKGYIAPWYTNGLHIVDEGFINEVSRLNSDEVVPGHVFVIGSSLSAMEYDPVKQHLRNGYPLYMFASGSGSWRTNIILDNLIRSNYSYTKKDIVKLEVSYSTFRNADDETIIESSIDKWGRYSVKEDFGVVENTPLLQPVYDMNVNLMKIQNMWEIVSTYFSPTYRKAQIGPANYRNNYFNHEDTSEHIAVTDDKIELIKSQIINLGSKTNVVIELSPISPELESTPNGQKYTEFVEKELKPWLKENEITCLDYRDQFSEQEFIDGAHLSYKASLRYTRRMNMDLNQMIRRVWSKKRK